MSVCGCMLNLNLYAYRMVCAIGCVQVASEQSFSYHHALTFDHRPTPMGLYNPPPKVQDEQNDGKQKKKPETVVHGVHKRALKQMPKSHIFCE